MEKFYAPTGVFRSGPISIAKESAEPSPAPQVEPTAPPTDPQTTPEIDKKAENRPLNPAEAPAPGEDIYKPSTDVGASVASSPVVSEKLPDLSAPKPQPKAHNTLPPTTQEVAESLPSDAQPGSFSEFANRWKRYLYPGQLAVMRALYDLTIPHGTSECFTRYSELAASTKMSRRNSIHVMNSLVERGFVERLEVRNNMAGKGIRLRIHLNPLH